MLLPHSPRSERIQHDVLHPCHILPCPTPPTPSICFLSWLIYWLTARQQNLRPGEFILSVSYRNLLLVCPDLCLYSLRDERVKMWRKNKKKRIKRKNWNRASGLYMTTNGKEVFSPGSLLLISRIWDQINKPLVTKMQITFLICLIQPLTFLQRFLFALCELQIVNISAGHSGIF